MRVPHLLCLLALAGCPEPPVAPAATAPVAQGLEGEPCAIGDRVVRQCGPRLTCVAKPHAPFDPQAKQILSADGSPCGGVAGIQCAEGLGCQLKDDDVMAADAMGTCRQESVCEPAVE